MSDSETPLAPTGGTQVPEPGVPTPPSDHTIKEPHTPPVTAIDPEEKWRPAMPGPSTPPPQPTPSKEPSDS
jgi:hypothetical protein